MFRVTNPSRKQSATIEQIGKAIVPDAWFKLDESTGGVAVDSMGGANGAYTNATLNQSGFTGTGSKAVKFVQASSAFCDLGNQFANVATGFGVALFFSIPGVGSINDDRIISQRGGGGTLFDCYLNGATSELWIYNPNPGIGGKIKTLTVGKNYSFVFGWNGATWDFWLNGVNERSVASVVPYAGITTKVYLANLALVAKYATCKISQVMLLKNRMFSSNEINALNEVLA